MKWQVNFSYACQRSVMSDFACFAPILKRMADRRPTAAGVYLDRVHRVGVAVPVPVVRIRLSRHGGYTAGEFVR